MKIPRWTTFIPKQLRCLKLQMTLLFVSLLVASMFIFTLRVIAVETGQRSMAMKMQAQVLARNLAAAGGVFLLKRDSNSIEQMLLRSMEFPGIMSSQMMDNTGYLIGDIMRDSEGKLVPRYGRDPLVMPHDSKSAVHISGEYLVVWQPVELGETLGWIRLTYSLQEIDVAADRIWKANINTGLLILMIVVVFVVLLLHRPVKTMLRYTRFADSLNKPSGEIVTVDKSSTELELLGHSLNRTSVWLSKQSQMLQENIQVLERLAAFVEHSPNLVVSLDKTGEIQYTNPLAQQVMDKHGLNVAVITRLMPTSLADIIEEITEKDDSRQGLERECCGRTYSWSFTQVEGQQIIHAYGVDVTEKKLAERKANDSYAARLGAEEANKTKSQFLASMSHELRTPLNAVIGYSEILSEDASLNGQDDYLPDLQKIRNSGKHLLSMINEILDLSKIEAGKMELFLEEFSLLELVDDVIGTAIPLADNNGNTLHLEFNLDDLLIKSDSTKLRQILFNLLSNACKFTRAGDITLSMDAITLLGQPAIDIRVKDSGIGMSKEQLERIFEPFTQASKDTSVTFGGTGLGLSITKRFSEMMGGEIQAISKLAVGTTFSVQLPQVVNNMAAEEYYSSRSVDPAVVRFGKNRMERRMALRKVLVIDDDTQALEFTERLLHKDGFLVQKAGNSSEALRQALMSFPDVILLDTSISGMDVKGMVYELKTNPDLKQVPVVLMSAKNNKDEVKKFGANGCISKPIIRVELSETIKYWVRHRVKGQALLVTDSPENVSVLKSSLGSLGLRVALAADKKTALTICNHAIPEIVLVDLALPDNTGTDVIEVLQKDALHHKLPLMSFGVAPASKEQQEKLDGTAYFQLEDAASDPSGLYEAIERLLQKRFRTLGDGEKSDDRRQSF